MEFYKIWKTKSGLIGVNKLTLGDLVGVQVTLVFLLMILVAVLVLFFPIIFFIIYLLLMIGQNGGSETSPTRLGVNIVTVITTIYFLLDFHFGWYSWQILAESMYAETYDTYAIRNLSVAFMSILLFFVGHEVYRASSNKLGSVVIILAFIFFGFKFTNNISTYIIKNVVTQYEDSEVTKSRAEMKKWDIKNHPSDEQLLQDKINDLEKEKRQIQRDKDFDENFARDYL